MPDATEIVDVLLDERAGDVERCADPDPCVLVLKRDGNGGGTSDITLSLLPPTVDARSIILCRAVRRTFFSANGKYSVRCVVMSSLGGRWPKKLRSLEGFLDDASVLAMSVLCVGEVGGSSALSGLRTPRPLRMLAALARLIAFARSAV